MQSVDFNNLSFLIIIHVFLSLPLLEYLLFFHHAIHHGLVVDNRSLGFQPYRLLLN